MTITNVPGRGKAGKGCQGMIQCASIIGRHCSPPSRLQLLRPNPMGPRERHLGARFTACFDHAATRPSDTVKVLRSALQPFASAQRPADGRSKGPRLLIKSVIVRELFHYSVASELVMKQMREAVKRVTDQWQTLSNKAVHSRNDSSS